MIKLKDSAKSLGFSPLGPWRFVQSYMSINEEDILVWNKIQLTETASDTGAFATCSICGYVRHANTKSVWWNTYGNTAAKCSRYKLQAHIVWLFKMPLKLRCAKQHLADTLIAQERKTRPIKNHTSWLLHSKTETLMLKNKANSAPCHYHLHGTMNCESGSLGQQRTGGLFHNLTSHRCPGFAPPLPVHEQSGLEVHWGESLDEGKGARMCGERRRQELRREKKEKLRSIGSYQCQNRTNPFHSARWSNL